MSGRNIAVISASMISDSENTRAGSSYEASGFTIMGHNRAMVANRISYTFNFTGMLLFCSKHKFVITIVKEGRYPCIKAFALHSLKTDSKKYFCSCPKSAKCAKKANLILDGNSNNR